MEGSAIISAALRASGEPENAISLLPRDHHADDHSNELLRRLISRLAEQHPREHTEQHPTEHSASSNSTLESTPNSTPQSTAPHRSPRYGSIVFITASLAAFRPANRRRAVVQMSHHASVESDSTQTSVCVCVCVSVCVPVGRSVGRSVVVGSVCVCLSMHTATAQPESRPDSRPHTPHGHTPISSPQWFVAVVERGAGGGGLAASLARSGLALAPPRARNEYYAKKSGEYLT